VTLSPGTGCFIDRPRHTCALGGALYTLRAIPRAVPVIHAASGCGFNIFNAVNAGAGHLGGGYCGGACWSSSNVGEQEIVFGGEDRLKEQILSTLEILDGDLYVVVSGCMTEMIGDDIVKVASEITDPPAPLLAIPTPSFLGNSSAGYDLILQGLFNGLVKKPRRKEKGLVNVLGLVPGQDVFYRGNLNETKRLLSLLGLKANTFFGDGESLESVKKAGKAELTILLSDVFGHDAAGTLKDSFGVESSVIPLPVGAVQAGEFLREAGKTLGISRQTVEKAVASEEARYYEYLERVADVANDIDFQRYTAVVSDANYAPSVTRFLAEELGWIPVLAVVTDPLDEEGETAVRKRFLSPKGNTPPEIRFGCHASGIVRYWREVQRPALPGGRYRDPYTPGVLVGSVYERELAEEAGWPLDILSFPATCRVVFQESRAGYEGGLAFASELFTLLVSGR
jgi:nitrogenase molybdenum-iron protein beta chain